MLTRDLISNSIPYLHKDDKVFHALQLMNDYHVAHLPVVENESYLGIISEEQLLQSDEENTIKELPVTNGTTSVQANDHFLKAIQTAVVNKLSIVPVVDEKQLVGIVTYNDLLKNASEFMSLNEPGALIVLELESRSYSFTEINVGEDRQAYEEMKELSNQTYVPTFVAGDKVLANFDTDQLEEFLREHEIHP